MRVSRLMLVTLRDDPAEAEIPSHKLLLRGGYIRRISSGIYAYLPLLQRVLRKISEIIRQEMDAAGALETLLPQLQPAELWKRSGRWQAYTETEGIMFHLLDRQEREFGLGPTHEEVITAIASDLLRSYKQLPVCLYQIQNKFRDEIRPRFGLMRGREFIMKDGYSFHADQSSLEQTYHNLDDVYRRIFHRCGLNVVAVEADSGAIGGSSSQEFMVTAASGEDLILSSPDGRYAANQERASSLAPEAVPLEASAGSPLKTPGHASIESLCGNHGFHPSQVLKVLLMVARFEDGTHQPLLISLRGDQQLNEIKLNHALRARCPEGGALLEVVAMTPELLSREGLAPLAFGFLGPHLADDVLEGARSWAPSFLRLTDTTALELQRFVCGANRMDQHLSGVSWDDLGLKPGGADLRSAQPGDRCLHDPSQTLTASRGIEVGHIFQLGQKYSRTLNASFTTASGEEEVFWMGCYGIGVSRLAQAAVEQHHDSNGICWPLPIAPFEVILVVANHNDAIQVTLAEDLYKRLLEAEIDVLLDDREERAGVKFKDADLIGIPWRLVVGRGAASRLVEVVSRSDGEKTECDSDEAISMLISQVTLQRNGADRP